MLVRLIGFGSNDYSISKGRIRLLRGLEKSLLYSCRYSGLILTEEGNVGLAIWRLDPIARKSPLTGGGGAGGGGAGIGIGTN